MTPGRTSAVIVRVLLSAAALAGAQAACGANAAPAFPPGTTQDTYFGTTVADPYRALEDIARPEVARWMKAQADYARATLDSIASRQALLERIRTYSDTVAARVSNVRRRPGDLYFYEKRAAADNQFKLYVRRGITGEERLLVDPDAIAAGTGKPHAISFYEPSRNGRLVAYGLSESGSENADLYVIETFTGKRVLGPVARAEYGGVDWLRDDRGLFFTRLQELKPGMDRSEKYINSRAVFVLLGADPEKAPIVLGAGAGGVKLDPATDSPFVGVLADGRTAAGVVAHGTARELTVYVAPIAGVIAGKPKWRKVIDRSDDVTAFEVAGDRLFALTHRGAPRFRVVETSLANPDLARAREVLPQSQGVVTAMARSLDALYLVRREGAVSRLLHYDLAERNAGKAPQAVALPVEGSTDLAGIDPRMRGALAAVQSWTRANQYYRIDAARAAPTALQPAGPYDALPDYVSTEVVVPSHDGASVPLSIVHRKGLVLDGSNPTLLWGYASYGITEEPWFSAWRLAWLERGGVYAVANPRGSGAFGQDWYKAGFQATKPNTWKDFIAAAEYLVQQKYTSPAKLGIWGGSAGGILIGRALTERPDLFAAAVSSVGVLDMVRTELEPNGPSNIPEFGTHKTEPGFRALLAMSTYHQIVDGVKYPAVLFTHGVNDPRVDVWQSLKCAARLQAASASGRPVLLSIDYESGHGIGDTKMQLQRERADVMAFLLWQFGVPGFQPRP